MLDHKKTFSTFYLLGFASPGLKNGMVQKPKQDRVKERAGDRVHIDRSLGKEVSN